MNFIRQFTILLCTLLAPYNIAHAGEPAAATDLYRLQPGDVLSISVWKETDLNTPVIVRPDGWINFPLVGEAKAAGSSVEELQALITEKLTKYIPDPVVSVSIQQL